MSSSTPKTCDLSAINTEDLEDHRKKGAAVFAAVNEIREVDNGYKFKLPAETQLIQKLGTYISREQLCCPFFEFVLTVIPDHDMVWLRLAGGKGVKIHIEETLLPKLDISVEDLN